MKSPFKAHVQKQIMVFGRVFPLEKKRCFIGFDVLHKDEGSLVKVSLHFSCHVKKALFSYKSLNRAFNLKLFSRYERFLYHALYGSNGRYPVLNEAAYKADQRHHMRLLHVYVSL